MTTGAQGTRRRTLLAPASVLAAQEAASMADIAARQRSHASLSGSRVAHPGARSARASGSVRTSFVLLRKRRPLEPGFTAPLEALLERERGGGQIRTDVPLATLVESLLVLVGACVRTGKPPGWA